MNERIKQIASDTDVWCDQHWAGSEFYDVQWEQKYAELIVQECLNICEEMGDNGKDGHYCADKIVKTFRS